MLQLSAPAWYTSPTNCAPCTACATLSHRLDWKVETSGGTRSTPSMRTSRIICAGSEVCGCVRVLASTGPTMLGDTFPALLQGRRAPHDPRIWESGRFALDLPPAAANGQGGV